MKIISNQKRLIIRELPRQSSGIIIRDPQSEAYIYSEVVQVSGKIIDDIRVGSMICHSKLAGTRFHYNKQEYKIIEEDDVFFVFNEDISEIAKEEK